MSMTQCLKMSVGAGSTRATIFLFTPRASTIALIDWAAYMLKEAFAPLDPITAQFELPVEKFVEIFAAVQAEVHSSSRHPRTCCRGAQGVGL